jgi:hypothetical protein
VAISLINGSLYGIPGVGIYDVSVEELIACCCKGIQVSGISFETIGEPDCFLLQQGSPTTECVYGDNAEEAALALAIQYIAESDYITKCNPTDETPNPEENFCQNATPEFSYTSAREIENGFEFDFEVEDCGIEPVDYIATVTVVKC